MRDASLVDGASHRPVNLVGSNIPAKVWDARKMLSMLHWLMNIFLACGLILLAMLLLAPRAWDLHFRTVASGSMQPAIPLGAIVFVRPVDADAIRVGDVITFRSPQGPDLVVTHRVISVTQQAGVHCFKTKGDANPGADLEPISEKAILGKVLFHIPYVGYASQFALQPTGWFMLVALPASILILIELIRILRIIWSHDQALEKTPSKKMKP